MQHVLYSSGQSSRRSERREYDKRNFRIYMIKETFEQRTGVTIRQTLKKTDVSHNYCAAFAHSVHKNTRRDTRSVSRAYFLQLYRKNTISLHVEMKQFFFVRGARFLREKTTKYSCEVLSGAIKILSNLQCIDILCNHLQL